MNFFDPPSLKKIPESELQSLLEVHPYLINTNFLNATLEPQKHLKSGISDLVFYLNNEIIVVELKIVPLDFEATLQLNGYLEDVKQLFPEKSISGILVGERPKDKILNLIDTLEFQIEIKNLHEDIPVEIKICNECRKASCKTKKKCFFCSCEEWL